MISKHYLLFLTTKLHDFTSIARSFGSGVLSDGFVTSTKVVDEPYLLWAPEFYTPLDQQTAGSDSFLFITERAHATVNGLGVRWSTINTVLRINMLQYHNISKKDKAINRLVNTLTMSSGGETTTASCTSLGSDCARLVVGWLR